MVVSETSPPLSAPRRLPHSSLFVFVSIQIPRVQLSIFQPIIRLCKYTLMMSSVMASDFQCRALSLTQTLAVSPCLSVKPQVQRLELKTGSTPSSSQGFAWLQTSEPCVRIPPKPQTHGSNTYAGSGGDLLMLHVHKLCIFGQKALFLHHTTNTNLRTGDPHSSL